MAAVASFLEVSTGDGDLDDQDHKDSMAVPVEDMENLSSIDKIGDTTDHHLPQSPSTPPRSILSNKTSEMDPASGPVNKTLFPIHTPTETEFNEMRRSRSGSFSS